MWPMTFVNLFVVAISYSDDALLWEDAPLFCVASCAGDIRLFFVGPVLYSFVSMGHSLNWSIR